MLIRHLIIDRHALQANVRIHINNNWVKIQILTVIHIKVKTMLVNRLYKA